MKVGLLLLTWSKLPPSTTPLDFLMGILLPFSIVIRGLKDQGVNILVRELNLLYKQLSQIQHGIDMLFSIVKQEEYIC